MIFRALDALRMYDLPCDPDPRRERHHDAVDPRRPATVAADQPNSASALSTITFILIFAISLLLVRLFNANIVGAQKPVKGAEVVMTAAV